MSALPPGSTIGILGGGQLGRMLAMAAARLGLKCHVYAPEEDSPAFDVVPERTIAGYDDEAALAKFAETIDAATYEFENIPVATVEFLSKRVPVRPGATALACAQDRINEKTLARSLGAGTADFAEINTLADLEKALKTISPPCVLKTRRFGYDGKGQSKILDKADAKGAFKLMHGQPSILESFVNFQLEVSVVAARSLDGEFRSFDVTENEHRAHILHRSLAPARITAAAAKDAHAIAEKIAECPRLRRRLRGRVLLPASDGCAMFCSSMKWRRACTTPATGLSTAPSPRSSSSTCAPSPAGRSGQRPARRPPSK